MTREGVVEFAKNFGKFCWLAKEAETNGETSTSVSHPTGAAIWERSKCFGSESDCYGVANTKDLALA